MRKLFFSLLLAASTMTMYAADGALTGKFTVNADGKQVVFSQGNLQYQASPTPTWRFATNQWDVVGNATAGNVYVGEVKCNNALIANDYTGWIDLFGWGTGDAPTKHTDVKSDYATFTDWGVNAISNGGNTPNMWYTLSYNEWNYLLQSRADAGDKKGQAAVGDIYGLVLLPDEWTLPSGLTFTPMPNNWTTNVYTTEQWQKMEANGAIFLPAAGTRYSTTVQSQNVWGDYHASTIMTEGSTSYRIAFKVDNIYAYDGDRIDAGQSVRLVRKVPQKGDTIRYEYAGNNLFYKITSKVEGKYEVSAVNAGGTYPDYYPNPSDRPKGTVVLPDSIEDFMGVKYAVIGFSYAFLTNCEEVTGLEVNNIMESMGSYGLNGTNITSIDTKNVKTMGYAVFSGVKISTVHIGAALETFYAYSYMLDYATKVTIDEANPNFTVDGTMLLTKDGKMLVGIPTRVPEAVFELPKSLDTIKDNVVNQMQGTLVYPKVIHFQTNNLNPTSYNILNSPFGDVIVPCHLLDSFTTGDFGKNFVQADTVMGKLLNTVKATAGANGTVAIKDTTDCNQVRIVATPNVGCNFVAWSTGSTDPTLVLNVVSDTTVKAIFEKQTFTVTIVAENGSVTAKDMMDAPVDLSQPIEYGMKLILIATPNDGYVFDSWTNYDPATGLTVTDNITVTATFKTKPTGFNQIDSKHSTLNTKRLINGQLFIQRGDELFNAQGTRVK